MALIFNECKFTLSVLNCLKFCGKAVLDLMFEVICFLRLIKIINLMFEVIFCVKMMNLMFKIINFLRSIKMTQPNYAVYWRNAPELLSTANSFTSKKTSSARWS